MQRAGTSKSVAGGLKSQTVLLIIVLLLNLGLVFWLMEKEVCSDRS